MDGWIKNRWMDKNGRLDGYNTRMVGWIKNEWIEKKQMMVGRIKKWMH